MVLYHQVGGFFKSLHHDEFGLDFCSTIMGENVYQPE